MEEAFEFLPVTVSPLCSGDVLHWPSAIGIPWLPAPVEPGSWEPGEGELPEWPLRLPPSLEATPQNGWGDGTLVWKGLQRQGQDLPAQGSLCVCVCVRQLPVCLLELCKQLRLNAPETLPNDRINPQGKQASVVKDYINVLKSPSTALRNRWSFSCLDKKVASGQSWEMPERPLSDLWALLSHPFLLVLLWDRLHGPPLCLCCWVLPRRSWGVWLPAFEQGQPPQHSHGDLGEKAWIRWLCPMAVAARAHPESQQLWKVGGGAKAVCYTCHKLFLDH